MRPLEKKVLDKITTQGVTFEVIEEIIDATPRPEMKKSYPDDSHFQAPRYFAKLILATLLRMKLVVQDGNLYKKPEKKQDNPA